MVSAVSGFLGGRKEKKESRKAAKRTKQLAEKNAVLEKTELTESLRVLDLEQEQARSATKASAAASGVTLTGSVSDYLTRQADEQKKAADFELAAGESRIEIIREGGRAQAKDIKARGNAAYRRGITNAFASVESAAVSWWL